MKKLILLLLTSILLVATACASGNTDTVVSTGSTTRGDTMNITITIMNATGKTHTLNATLAENKSAVAFAELLKKGAVTVAMHDYGSFEKVGSLGSSLPRTDTQITTEAGDIILYQGNQITIYYDTNSWNFTRLGKVVSTLRQGSVTTSSTTSITQAELKQILGKGDVTAVFDILR